jgi:glutamine synthetase
MVVVKAEYVWIDGTMKNLRSKCRTLNFSPENPGDLPIWNFDGSSTGQAEGHDSEVLLRPVRIFKDPFRGPNDILVMCECLDPKFNAIPSNTYNEAKYLFDQAPEEKPWFGLEQEYTLFELDEVTPLGWPKNGYPEPQGKYYCGTGADRMYGRQVAEDHYSACLYAGIKVSGVNAEVMPGQWEYQVGPCEGIEAGDHLWMSRYIMHRVCEKLQVICNFEPKPMKGDWNGAGCHTNYSTEAMRNDGGYDVILKAIEKLGDAHAEHIAAYGEGNEDRLTGAHETASWREFSWGVANRGASVRVGREIEREGKGYLEDRRPASNCDPYVVTSLIFKTTCL